MAVYDGDPKWIEIELDFKDEEFFNVGFLEFTGEEKIFPVDGQHRVEGIKAALKENQELKSEEIPVIFIGHKKNAEGMQRTRRLFNTLNRYAKPVSFNDIIALDEDDIAAITTRMLIENFSLFLGDRIISNKIKAIPETNKTGFTSVITLYQCNRLLLEHWLKKTKPKKKVDIYIKMRPNDNDLAEFYSFCQSFWDQLVNQITDIKNYLLDVGPEPTAKYRNKEEGGNLLFRPIGLIPFVMSVLAIVEKSDLDYEQTLVLMNNCNLGLDSKPWPQVLWNPFSKKMLRADNVLVSKLLLYLAKRSLLNGEEILRLKHDYADKISLPFTDDIFNDL